MDSLCNYCSICGRKLFQIEKQKKLIESIIDILI